MHRCRFAGEHQQAVSVRVPGQIDENINLIVANSLCKIVVRHAKARSPMVRGSSDTRGKVVVLRVVVITEYFEICPVVALDQRRHKMRNRMMAKIRRDVADP